MSSIGVNTNSGVFGVNGNLNIQGGVSASAFAYFDSSGVSHDITTALENVGNYQTEINTINTNISTISGLVATNTSNATSLSGTVSNIISGSQVVLNATNATNLNITNVDTSGGPYYLNLASSNATGNGAVYSCSKINVDPVDGIIGATGGFVTPLGPVIAKSCNFASGYITISSSGALVVSGQGSLNGASSTQVNYISSVSGGIVDLSSTQTIAGAKTFSSACVFSSGFSTSGETDLGTLSVSGLISANGGLTIPSSQALTVSGTLNGASSTQVNYISSVSGGIVDLSSTQTIAGAKTFSSACVFNGNFSTTSETIVNSLKYNKGSSLYYQPSSYGGIIAVNAANVKLFSVANTGTLNAWYHINTTYITSVPTLVLPDPTAALVGCEIKFVKCNAANNAVYLTTSTPASSNFLISASATDISPNFTLGSTWYKVGFVCLPNPDATNTPYCRQQILYQ